MRASERDLALKHRLNHVVDLRIPHFLHTVSPGTVGQRAFDDRSTVDWYDQFVTSAIDAIGNTYLPILRLSDGEFYFSVGYRPPKPPKHVAWIWHYLRTYLGALRVGRLPGRFRSGAPKYGWEEFIGVEWYRLRREFVKYLRHTSENGIVAINFSVTEPPFAEQYFEPFCDWLDKNQIIIKENNFYPFYFVYALLNGPDSSLIYEGNRILIVTSYDDRKREALTEALEAKGAVHIEFLSVSRNKAMKDSIDPMPLRGEIDVALVAAGIGASKMLYQLEPLNTLCIDAGFCLEILADPSKQQNRVFCVPDPTPV